MHSYAASCCSERQVFVFVATLTTTRSHRSRLLAALPRLWAGRAQGGGGGAGLEGGGWGAAAAVSDGWRREITQQQPQPDYTCKSRKRHVANFHDNNNFLLHSIATTPQMLSTIRRIGIVLPIAWTGAWLGYYGGFALSSSSNSHRHSLHRHTPPLAYPLEREAAPRHAGRAPARRARDGRGEARAHGPVGGAVRTPLTTAQLLKPQVCRPVLEPLCRVARAGCLGGLWTRANCEIASDSTRNGRGGSSSSRRSTARSSGSTATCLQSGQSRTCPLRSPTSSSCTVTTLASRRLFASTSRTRRHLGGVSSPAAPTLTLPTS